MNELTRHAASRIQQRGIMPETIGMLLECGARSHDHRGGVIVYFNKPARQRVREKYGSEEYRKLQGLLDAYAVVAQDGSVITVGHRTKRINRH